jgi:hypothetical protein
MKYINSSMDEDLASVSIDDEEVSELRRLLDLYAEGQLP